ncbi:MAG: YqgE/AlgH family protein [Candidatus Parcubacteria bacterium]|nr:YqgE/AlgH family protein [Burkholderiales bacterium]
MDARNRLLGLLFPPFSVLVSFTCSLLLPTPASAQQDLPANGLFLVAKPSLGDPNFAKTVVLVTQTEDASTVGVIINRPTALGLAQFVPQDVPAQNYRDQIYFGGPVMRQSILALYRSGTAPEKPAFHVLRGVYLSMHPDNLRKLLEVGKDQYRLYAGFSGWAPRQLESEFMRDGWFVLPADEATVFRKNTEGLWEELVERAANRGPRAHNPGVTIFAKWPAPCDC